MYYYVIAGTSFCCDVNVGNYINGGILRKIRANVDIILYHLYKPTILVL